MTKMARSQHRRADKLVDDATADGEVGLRVGGKEPRGGVGTAHLCRTFID
jgi:hypothetical protein